jgi:hypothetical protein
MIPSWGQDPWDTWENFFLENKKRRATFYNELVEQEFSAITKKEKTHPPPIVVTILAPALFAALKTILFRLLSPARVSFKRPNRSSGRETKQNKTYKTVSNCVAGENKVRTTRNYSAFLSSLLSFHPTALLLITHIFIPRSKTLHSSFRPSTFHYISHLLSSSLLSSHFTALLSSSLSTPLFLSPSSSINTDNFI